MEKYLKELGQLFVIGFPGSKPSASFLNFLSEESIGGVIFFKDNCPTHLDARQNISAVRASCAQHLPFIALDQEGGRVNRVAGAPAEYAAAADYGRHPNGLDKFRDDYTRSAVFLVSLGFNVNLAPVCDLFINEKNKCLEGRCFGKTPEQAIPFVITSVEIASSAGLICCLKHFPGLGASATDPHSATAIADYDDYQWDIREGQVFAAGLKAGADIVMTTHLKVPRLDQEIVTSSAKIVKNLLRERLSFDGPVITDDLCMKGAEAVGSIGERTVAAFNVGHDLLLFGQDIEASMEAYEYFRSAYQNGEVSPERVENALNRVAGLKYKLSRSLVL